MNEYFTTNDIARGFSKVATTYAQSAVLQREVGKRLIERLGVVNVQPECVLDLGCGIGEFTQTLNKKYRQASVIGIDLAEVLLQTAYRQRPWFRPYHLACADAQQLPFADNSFDFIFSNLMIHWISDSDVLWRECLRVMRPNGCLFFTATGPDTLKEIRQAWSSVDDFPHVHPFKDMHHIGDDLMRAGFSNPVIDRETLSLHYPDVMSLLRELQSSGVSNKSLQSRRHHLTGKQRFKQFIKNFEQYKTHDDKYPANYEIIYGHAWAPNKTNTEKLQADNTVRISVDKIQRKRS